MIPNEAVEAAVQTYHEEIGDCTIKDAMRAALTAAAPFLRAQALEDAADELDRLNKIGAARSDSCTAEEKSDYRAYAEFDGGHSDWLRARAVTERGGE
jgi:hypothetical protein